MSDFPPKLGKYEIRRAIGKGAMGIVYEGFDPVIDRIVAIKTIKLQELDQKEAEEYSRRFLIEAKAAGRLNHKNIVGIYDYGEEKGLSFIVMEFVQGKELKSFFEARHPFSMSQIVRLMGELLDALGYSHSRGVIHRDVKPDNIFVTDDGVVKLGDFGIARIDASSKTHAGTVLGTPSYMSPEQIRGETADARSDLYAVGVILYQFLVGERPFSGGMIAVMQKVLAEMPKAPSAHNPSIPPGIDAVVLRALAKRATDRFPSAAEFRRELTAAVGLANADDESEPTMVMSVAALRELRDSPPSPDERTGGTAPTGGTGSRSSAIEEARRRAEETRRRYEEDMRRAESELQLAEEQQRLAEEQAQRQADEWLRNSQALLDESDGSLEAARTLLTQQTLLIGAADAVVAGRSIADRLRDAAKDIGQFVSASETLGPTARTALEFRRSVLDQAAAAQDELVVRIDREAHAAQATFDQEVTLLEQRLSGQDGAWHAESAALAELATLSGEESVAPITGRLDKLGASVEQVGEEVASLQSKTLVLPRAHLDRLAAVDANWQRQAGEIARVRTEADAALNRSRSALEGRRSAEEAARQQANEAAAVRSAEANEQAAVQALGDAGAGKAMPLDADATRILGRHTAESDGLADAESDLTVTWPAKAAAETAVSNLAPAPAPAAVTVSQPTLRPDTPTSVPRVAAKKGIWAVLPVAAAALLAVATGAWFVLRPPATPVADAGVSSPDAALAPTSSSSSSSAIVTAPSALVQPAAVTASSARPGMAALQTDVSDPAAKAVDDQAAAARQLGAAAAKKALDERAAAHRKAEDEARELLR